MTHSILISEEEQCCTIRFNRPEKKNALNHVLLTELYQHLEKLSHSSHRVLILTGVGEVFCAGADLQEMADLATPDNPENYRQALQLAQLLNKLNQLPIFTIAKVNGDCFGGALGLLCCCDMVIAKNTAGFCFSELKLGLVPATIIPYVLDTIGCGQARRYVLNAEPFNAQQALQMGLVHQIANEMELDEKIQQQCQWLLKTQPSAFKTAKQLIQKHHQLSTQQIRICAQQLAQIRTQIEAQKGIQKFLLGEK